MDLNEPEPAAAACLQAGGRGFPEILARIDDPPRQLHVLGRLNTGPAVAIVGSRNCSRYGLGVATRLAADLGRAGVSIVSGLARGIDAAAHRGALTGGGHTVAVLPGGLRPIYPRRHARLADRIARQGALVAEHAVGTAVRAWHFPKRNRIIAGLAEATVVVEAAARSGARITAELALGYHRDVLVVPGPIDSPTSAGCHALLADGAAPCVGADSVLEVLTDRGHRLDDVPGREPPADLAPAEKALYEALLGAGPRRLDELSRELDIPPPLCMVASTGLELRGLALLLPGNRIAVR
jgi:DNA processing protein